MPKRLNRAPGQVHNQIKEKKKQEQEAMMEKDQERAQRHMERGEHIKELIEETNFGGREMPKSEYVKM